MGKRLERFGEVGIVDEKDFFFISVKKLQYEFTSYTTLQDYHTIQLYNSTEMMPRGVKDYDYPETN